MKMVNNRGQVGMDVAKSVIVTILIIGVIAFALMIAFSTLGDTSVVRSSAESVVNQTTAAVTERGVNLKGLVDCAATVTSVTNASHDIAGSGNYTVNGCAIKFSGADGADTLSYNNTAWNVTYSYTYNQFGDASQNITTGANNFFSNATTWFSLLAVVVIILIIAIVIFAVNRFGGRSTGL